jgi:hypothetical protein
MRTIASYAGRNTWHEFPTGTLWLSGRRNHKSFGRELRIVFPGRRSTPLLRCSSPSHRAVHARSARLVRAAARLGRRTAAQRPRAAARTMIMWIPQLISCGIHMKSEILSDDDRPARGAARQPPHGPHGHRAPLKSMALGPQRRDCRQVAVRDGELVELDEASWPAGAERGDGGYKGVYVVGLQVPVERGGVGVDLVEVEASGVSRASYAVKAAQPGSRRTWRTSSTMRSRNASARPAPGVDG